MSVTHSSDPDTAELRNRGLRRISAVGRSLLGRSSVRSLELVKHPQGCVLRGDGLGRKMSVRATRSRAALGVSPGSLVPPGSSLCSFQLLAAPRAWVWSSVPWGQDWDQAPGSVSRSRLWGSVGAAQSSSCRAPGLGAGHAQAAVCVCDCLGFPGREMLVFPAAGMGRHTAPLCSQPWG